MNKSEIPDNVDGWVQTAARIKPHWQTEGESAETLISIIPPFNNDQNNKLVVTSRSGVKLSTVKKLFKRDEDISAFRESFKDKIETYKFDSVFGTSTNQDQVYSSYFSDATKQLFQGVNAAFLVYGPSSAGKSFSFSGNEAKNEKGLIFQVCDDILGVNSSTATVVQRSSERQISNPRPGSQGSTSSGNKTKGVKVSIFSIYADEIFDLLQSFSPKNIKQELEEKSLTEVKITNVEKKSIKTPAEFKQAYSQSIQNLLMLGEQLREHNYYGKSHVVVQFEVKVENTENTEKKSKTSKVSVIRLADTDIYENSQESAKNDFAVLKRYLTHCAKFTEVSPTYKLYKQSKLTFALRDSINEASNIRLLCCANTNPTAFIPSLNTLEYFGRMITGSDRSLLQQSLRQGSHDDTLFYKNEGGNIPGNSTTPKGKNSSFLNASENQASFQNQTLQNQNHLNDNRQNNPNQLTQQQLQQQQQQSTEQLQQQSQSVNIEQLIAESEDLMQEMNKNSSQTQRLSIQQRNFWISEKQNHLKNLVSLLDLNSYNQPQSQVNYCDSILQSIARMLNRLKSPPQGISGTESSDEEVADIKQRIDRQIYKLQESQSGDKSRDLELTTHQNRTLLSAPQRDTSMIYQNNNCDTDRRRQETLDGKFKDATLRNQDLQEQMKQKDIIISTIDKEMKNCQDDLLFNMEKIRQMDIKEENWARIEQQIREQNEFLKSKLIKKKQKIQGLRLDSQSKNRNNSQIQNELMNKIDQLQQLLGDSQAALEQNERRNNDLIEEINVFKDRCDIKENQMNRLQEELEDQKVELNRSKLRLEQEMNDGENREIQIKSLSSQLEEANDLVNALEIKNNKLKSSYEVERADLHDQIEQMKKSKKEKNKQVKKYVEELEEKIAQLESEKNNNQGMISQNQNALENTAKELEQIKGEFSNALQEAAAAQKALENSEVEAERLLNLTNSLEDRIRNLEGGSLSDARVIQQLKQQLQNEQDQNGDLTQINSNLEIQLQELEQTQSQQICMIEEQVDQLVQEIHSSKALNEEFKDKEENFKKQINSLNDVIETAKEKYYKCKHSNKALKQQIKSMEDKYKELETQKLLDQKEHEKLMITQKFQQRKDAKLKTIDEIQGLIQSVKNTRSTIM